MTSDTAAIAVGAALVTGDVIAIAFLRIWQHRPTRLTRLLADHDDAEAIIRAVTDDQGRSL